MGLLSKIKNVLFEEEEIEIPVYKKEPEKKEEPVRVVRKPIEPKIKKEEAPREKVEVSAPREKIEVKEDNERETFKTEPTFQFPVFDEDEFNEPPKKTVKVNHDRPKNNHKKIDFGRFDTPAKPKEEPKRFVPSPVISPVFGVLDKNYVKKDLKPKKENVKEKVVSVDDVRKKAYGTLEDQIESTFDEPVKQFYEEKPSKTINDLLIDAANEEIPIEDVEVNDIEVSEEEINETSSLEVLDEIKKDVDKSSLEDTLESDLFNLIDSMYTSKEDEK